MTFTMPSNKSQTFDLRPVTADHSTSLATLSGITLTSSNPALIQCDVLGPTNPTGIRLTGKGLSGSVDVTASATATEANGTTTETVSGILTVTLTDAPAASLIFVAT